MFTPVTKFALSEILTKYDIPGDAQAGILGELCPDEQCLWVSDADELPISSAAFSLGDEPIPATRFRGAADYAGDHEVSGDMVSLFVLGADDDRMHTGYVKPNAWSDLLKAATPPVAQAAD
jgi:hypothetical protein